MPAPKHHSEPLAISPTIKAQWQQLVRENYTGVFDHALEDAHFTSAMAFESKQAILSHILQSLPVPPIEPFLEIGSGYGTFSLYCRTKGYRCYGVDPDAACLFISQLRQKELQQTICLFSQGTGERLPFKTATFGLVLLDNVIEHVQDIDAVIAEAFRVLKPGGYLYLLAPNYAAFRKEAHYGLPWVPLLPRAIARPYIRRFRGNTAFFDTLNYTTSWGIWRKIRRHTDHFLWPTQMKLDRPERCHNPLKRRALTLAKRLKLTPVLKTIEAIRLRNPCIRRIEFLAQKPALP